MFDHSQEVPMTTQKPCLDCSAVTQFTEEGEGTCPDCGLGMHLADNGMLGRYPPTNWAPGGIQGYPRD
jgi:hypothetical protein